MEAYETPENLYWINEYEPLLLKMRHWLHRHPETAMQEYRTTAYIAKQLERAGIPYRIIEDTGIIADLTVDTKLPTIVVRAEIDALPVQEDTGLSFSSVYPGKMHACGHDANTAIALCMAAALAEHRECLKYNIRFLYEPAEETGEGAKYMMEHGALEDPRPKAILIYHFGNQENCSMEIQKSVTTAAIGGLHITASGKASHFSQYEEGIDAMYGAARLVTAVREINRTFPTRYPFILGLGCMKAGAGRNSVCEYAELDGSLRTFSNEDFDAVFAELKRQAEMIGQETNVRFRTEITRKIPPIINDSSLVEKGKRIGSQLFGERFHVGEKPFLVGDNAAYYMEEVPGMRVVFLAGKPGEKNLPIHNPGFDIDESVMPKALQFLISFVSSN